MVVTDFIPQHQILLKSVLKHLEKPGADWRFLFVPIFEKPDQWDIAIVRPGSLEAFLAGELVDLGPLVEKAYPPHKGDFIVPLAELPKYQELKVLPVAFSPEFLFVRDKPEWNGTLSADLLQEYLKTGTIGLPEGDRAEWYKKSLNLPEGGYILIDPFNNQNEFLSGEIQAAIGGRRWLVERAIPGLSVHSLMEIGLDEGVPDWGYRLMISRHCSDFSIAEETLKHLLTEGQEMMLGLGDSFPVRRSVYSSPRMLGALLGVGRRPFDQTIENLILYPELSLPTNGEN